MTQIVGGHNLGLFDSSQTLLGRSDPSHNGSMASGVAGFANVSNGNLMYQERDAFMPSLGPDFDLVRTYNSRGVVPGAADGWSYSTSVKLESHIDSPAGGGSQLNYTVTYGDLSSLHFDFDAQGNRWVATDGAGAFEVLTLLPGKKPSDPNFLVVRADQSQYRFDKQGALLSIKDTNGVSMTFTYQGGTLRTVQDDSGHTITFVQQGNQLTQVTKKSAGESQAVTLATYTYAQSQLVAVTDRFGHVTRYSYDNDGMLVGVSLPDQQTVNGAVQNWEPRQLSFTYDRVQWDDHPHLVTDFDKGFANVLTSMTDAKGGVTTFDYAFQFSTTAAPDDRDAHYKPLGSRSFIGGGTRVVDSMGNGLATSNAADFQQKRVELGYAADVGALTQAHKDALRQLFSMSYAYDADGYITRVTDQSGLYTSYTYGARSPGLAQTAIDKDNLLSVTDRNGAGATTSDSAHFRAVRKDLGYVDAAGNGKLVANLSAAEKAAILARFTTSFTYDASGNLLTSTDGEGNLTRYAYAAFNKITSMVAAMGHALATSNDALYQAKRVELGYPAQASSLSAAQQAALRGLYTTSYAYDARQNLVRRTDPGGDVTAFEYDANGNLTRRIVFLDPNDTSKQQVTRYFYDGFGNNVETIDGEGFRSFASFDRFGNLLSRIDGRGGVTTHTFDADNRLLTSTDPEGHVTVNAYDAVGNRVSLTDAGGHTITQVFDRNNMLVTTIDPALSGAGASRSTNFKYDILGNRTEATDAEGRKTVYVFDARRQLVDVRTPLVIRADGTQAAYSTTYAYDGESRIVTLKDNNGNVTQTLYTPHGLLKRVTDAIGNVTEHQYDANLQTVQITVGAQLAPALRRVLRFSYDEENQLVAEIDAMGFVTRTAYDAPGNVVALTDANNRTTQFEYDRNNRLVKEIRPLLDGQTVPYTVLHRYDGNGNEVETIDENGHGTRVWFDKDDRRVMISDANGIETVFDYDSRHNQTRVAIGVQAHVDGAGRAVIDDASQGQVSTFVYDEFNQVVASTDGVGNALVGSDATVYRQLRLELGFAERIADLSAADKTDLLNRFTERFAFDRVGNLVKSVDHLGRITAFGYDALNRLIKRIDAKGGAEQRVNTLRYDGNGNIVKATDALGHSGISRYDGVDRLVETVDPLGIRTTVEYDNVGNRIASTADAGTLPPADRTTRYVYDLNNRLTSQTDPEGHAVAYEYDAVGNRLKVVDARAKATAYVYDALDRNIKIIDPLGFRTEYVYDGVGNRLQLIDANGGITRFVYDPGNRHVETTDAEGRITRLAYDPLGQAVTRTTGILRPAGGPDDLSQAQTTTFRYDAEGNLRSVIDADGKVETRGYDEAYNYTRTTDRNGHTTTYGFDAHNRQIRVTDALGGVRTFSYDAADNRLSETDQNAQRALTSDDAYYRALRLALDIRDATGTQGKLVAELTAADKAAIEAAFTRTFAYDDNDRLIVETDGAGTETHYAYDPVGNQVRITRAANRAGEEASTTFVYDRDDRLVAQVDAVGHALASSNSASAQAMRLALGFAADVTALSEADKAALRALYTTTYGYNPNDSVNVVTDPEGHVTTYGYDANNRIKQIVDGVGNVTVYRYDGNGNRNQVVDGRGFVNTTYFNRNNEVSLSVDAEGYATKFVYDANGNVITRTLFATALSLPVDPALEPTPSASAGDRSLRFEYDPLNRLSKGVSAEGYVREFDYDALGNPIELREARDLAGTDVAATRRYFDALGREVARITPERYLVTSAYDAAGNRIASTTYGERVLVPAGGALPVPAAGDAGRTTAYRYDVNDRLVEEIGPLGSVTGFSYDRRGNQIAIAEAVGTAQLRTTVFLYDEADRLVGTEHPDGTVTRLVLDADGNIRERHEAFGTAEVRVAKFDYNGNHDVTREENVSEGIVTLFRYDASRNLIEKVLASGSADQLSETFEYDRDQRLIAQVNAKGERTSFEYDGAGNRTRVVQAAGLPEARENRFEYDLDDRQVAAVDGIGSRTEYGFDGQGNRLSTRQAVGVPGLEKTTRYVYDLENRLIEVVSPQGAVTRYGYDVLGNKTSVTDGNGGVTTRSFDAQGRVVAETSAENVLTTLVYDAHGNLLSRTTDGKTIGFGYDRKGRQVEVIDGEGFTTRISYDRLDRQTKIERGLYLVDPGDAAYDQAKKDLEFPLVAEYAYDRANRLRSMTDGEGNVTRYEYDRRGNRTAEIVAFGVVGQERRTSYVYDAANQLIRIESPAGGIKEFSYDAVGNAVGSRTLQSGDPIASPATAVWITETFEYDHDGRQTAAVNGLGFRTERGFDAVGNLLFERVAAGTADVRTTSFEYNLDNHQIAETDAEGHRTEYMRDAMGNRIKVTDALGREARYYFNAANKLVAILDAEGYVNRFQYDASGNRIEARIYMQKYTGPVDDFVAPVVATGAGDRVVTTRYDNDDNVIELIQADGQSIAYLNDSTGTMRQRSMFSSEAGVAPRVEQYGYDLNGRLSYFRDVDGSQTTFSYDAANNKTRETIIDPAYAPGDPNRTRITDYAYDLDNRGIRETYDPNGLNIAQELHYDKLGNVVRKVDANGTVTVSQYDLNNRLTEVVVDPSGLALRTRFEYDRVGNQTVLVDAGNNVSNFEYDRNNRLLREILPTVTVYSTRTNAEQSVRPTSLKFYDAVGNTVQTIDANGNKTTQYFNGNDQVVAVLRGDNTLAEFAYNAANELVEERLYMERLPATAHDVNVRPLPLGTDVRVTNREYDLGGRLLRVIHPLTRVTTLGFANAANPTDSTLSYRTQEVIVYNGFGDSVEVFDRNAVGQQPATGPLDPSLFSPAREVSYYDAKGRAVASVNAEGFLTEWDYDGQDNVIAQRSYKVALNMSQVSPLTRPGVAALGIPESFSRRYDTVNRLVEEVSSEIEVLTLDPANPAGSTSTIVRVVTHHGYDAMGNEISRTRAHGTAAAATDYFYRDAAGRLVALVNSDKVLHQYGYDANGNQTSQRRYFDAVSLSDSALRSATLAILLADVTPDIANDQTTVRVYDALNRLTRETDLMNLGTATDDLVKSTLYDALGNKTKVTDERGFVSKSGYDEISRLNELESPDGSGTLIEYDAAGNAVLIYTGRVDNTILPGSVGAVRFDNLGSSSESDDLFTLSWTLPAGVEVQSYLVWSTTSQLNVVNPDTAYTGRTALGSTMGATDGAASIAAAGTTAGSRVYFRVVSEDRAGNKAWSKEQSFLVPPRFRDVEVRRPGPSQLAVRLRFDAGVVNPRLLVSGQAAQAFVAVGGGVYEAIVNVAGDPKALNYQILWQDSAGGNLASAIAPFRAGGSEIGTFTTLAESVSGAGSSVSLGVKIATGNVTGVSARWRAVGSNTGFASTGAIAAGSTAAGVDNFALGLGGPLAAGAYDVILVGRLADGSEVTLDNFRITAGNGSINGRSEQSLSWTLPEVGDDPDVGNQQLVVINGQKVASSRDGGRLLVDAALGAASSAGYAALYGVATGVVHNVVVNQRVVTTAIGTNQHRVDAYQLSVSATSLPAGALVAWRPAGSGIDFSSFANPGALFTVATSGALPRQYDLKVYYVDGAGREVIVDWARVTISGPAFGAVLANPGTTSTILNQNSESLTVLARETDGSVSRGANATDNAYAFSRGLYTGPVSDETLVTPLALVSLPTASAANVVGSSAADGLSRGYFTENEYDALNAKVATNEGDGLWRRVGVDANGNAVATRVYGTRSAESGGATPLVSHTRYNARNYKTAEYGVMAAVDANADGVNEGSARAVTLFTRDFLDRVTLEINARGTTTTSQYNALGLLTSETLSKSATLSSRQLKYDLLGNLVKEIDGLGQASYHVHAGDRLLRDVDALGHVTQYQYDSYGRRTRIITPGMRTSATGPAQSATLMMSYDQRDRLVDVVDGRGLHTRYAYDGRDNRTSMTDANGHVFGTSYDAMNRVETRTSRQSGQLLTKSQRYDYYGNMISETDEMGRTRSSQYGAFGRKLSEVDEGGRVTTFGYDDLGRLRTQARAATGANMSVSISRNYDAAGRLTQVADATTGVSTDYTYDVAGDRAHESVNSTGHLRRIAYRYDDLGRMTQWNDSAQGVSLRYEFDMASNLRRALGSNGVDHLYTYDNAHRLLQVTDGATAVAAYTYDAAGNRASYTTGGTTFQYQYDLNRRVTEATSPGATVSWTYDNVGNVTQFNDAGKITNYSYYENNRNYVTDDLGAKSKTTLSLDKSGRILTTLLVDSSGDDPSTFTFVHQYTADGRETEVKGTGDASGTSVSTYDANDNLVAINLGQGDKQASAETKAFVYNNDNQIIYRNHVTGETADSVGDDNTPRLNNSTEFYYANGNPVGDKGSTETSSQVVTVLDDGRYNLVKPIGSEHPNTSVNAYRVLAGDTLQSIADRLYGNPSLWFVLADANGLTGASALKVGTQLQVPNTVQTGRITDANHAVYDQNEITGSTLPNLKSPEPSGCALFLAIILIILIIIIAVVVAIVTFGAGSAISGLIAGAGITGVSATLLTIAATAVVGAAVAFVGALVTQGLLIAFGVQKEIDWKAVAAESVAGAFAGIASGISAAVKVAIAAGKLAALGARLANAVKVVAVGLSGVAGAGGEALRQVIIDGKVTSWASVAGAAVGAALSTGAVIKTASAGAKAASKAAALGKSVDDITNAATKASKVTAARFDVIGATADIVTEWAKVAEIAIRHEIDSSSPAPTFGDFMTAVGGTVAGGLSIGITVKGNLSAFGRGSTAAPADASVPRLNGALAAADAGAPTRVPNNNVAQPAAPVQVARVAGQGDGPPARPLAALPDGGPPALPPRRNAAAPPVPPRPAQAAIDAALGRVPARGAVQGAGGPPPVPPRPAQAAIDAALGRVPARAAVQGAGGPPPVPPRPAQAAIDAALGRVPARAAVQGAGGPPPVPPRPAQAAIDAALGRVPARTVQGAGGPPPVPPRPAQAAIDAALGRTPARAVQGAGGPPPVPPRPIRPAPADPGRLQRFRDSKFWKGTEISRPAGPDVAQLGKPSAAVAGATLTVEFKGFKEAAVDTLKSELLGRAVDLGFTVIVGAAEGSVASGVNWLMTGRYGKTNPGQAARSAIASATSLQIGGNGAQIRLLGSPIDTRSVNTGSRAPSLIGVPRSVDALQSFAQIAASVGKDQAFLIGGPA